MPLPIIAAAIGLGAGRALYGMSRARQRSRQAKGVINQAYGVAATDLANRQSDIRQSGNESLNARGVLQSGAVGGPVSPIGQALSGKTDWTEKGGKQHLNRTREQGFYTASGANSLGTSNTLSGGENRIMTDEFYRERSALNERKSQALDSVKSDTKDAYLNSIVGGINTGLSVYGMGSGVSSEPTGQPGPDNTQTGASGIPTTASGPMPPVTGYAGLPANPSFSIAPPNIGQPGQSNATFNVGRGPQP